MAEPPKALFKRKNKDTSLFFCYNTTKQSFEQMQLDYLERKSAALVRGTFRLWSREKVNAYKTIIRRNKQKDFVPEDIANYEVIEDFKSGRLKLVSKSRRYFGERVEVIPWEDSFEVILLYHRLLGHRGDCKNFYRLILSKYIIDKIWITFLLRACNACQSVKRMSQGLNTEIQADFKCYQVFHEKMTKPDYPFIYIMIVVDKITNFIQIRPLAELSVVLFASELFKIYTDFGIPKALLTNELNFYDKVAKVVSSYTDSVSTLVLPIQAMDIAPWPLQVISHLEEWMDVTNSTNWSFGCQVVQWQMNNTVRNGTISYEKMFHSKPLKEILG